MDSSSSHVQHVPAVYVQKAGRVFVGNIPMYATEAELALACSVFGPVVSFKLVVDKNTGRHKGYGFCEFRDEETALSAKRNQEGLLCQGRQLRIDMAHSAEERRKASALKKAKAAANIDIKLAPANSTKQINYAKSTSAERELDVFALRQAMKLRQGTTTAAKSSPKKRASPSDGTFADDQAGPAKKALSMYEEDRLRQGRYVPSAVVIEYASPAPATSARTSEGQTEVHINPKDISDLSSTTNRENHKSLQCVGMKSTEVDLIFSPAAPTTMSTTRTDHQGQPAEEEEDLLCHFPRTQYNAEAAPVNYDEKPKDKPVHAHLKALLHLLMGANHATSIYSQYQHIHHDHEQAAPHHQHQAVHNMQFALAAL